MAGDPYNDRSVDSKLRMLLNGDAGVNARRAEYSGAVRITQAAAQRSPPKWSEPKAAPERPQPGTRRRVRRGPPTPPPFDDRAPASGAADDADAFESLPTTAPPGDTGAPPAETVRSDQVTFSVFAEICDGVPGDRPSDPRDDDRLGNVTASRDRLRALQLTFEQLNRLVDSRRVPWIEAAQDLRLPNAHVGAALRDRPPPAAATTLVAGTESEAPDVAAPPEADAQSPVLVGIIDVGGFDFEHPDFLVPGDPPTTRFAAIWDQGGTLRGPPRDPRLVSPAEPMFTYGSVITADHMNAAIAAAREGAGAPAWRLEPQSVMRPDSHGTHVASIAAGNSGVCPDAMIAGVLVDIPELQDSRLSFYDTSRIVHAVEWLVALAESAGAALSVNVSLATNGHAHDASSAGSRWLDAVLASPGRAIAVAAGNSGQEAAQSATDLGWMLGRVHSEGHIAGPGLTHELEWLVVGDGTEDISENELEIWYSAQDRFAVQVRAPDGTWLPRVGPGDQLLNRAFTYTVPGSAGTAPREQQCFVTVANDTYYPANGANRVAVYLSPDLNQIHGVMPGRWLIRILGERIRDGRFHAWIERDDPGRVHFSESRRVRRYPSFFSERSNVDRCSVSSLACGHRVVSVANLDASNDRIHPSSSQGPTRDGRPKPEIAAPGTSIVAARGFTDRGRPWISMTGTSMASPHVCGVAARMLAVNPRLTAAQIGSIMRATARPLPSADYSWRDDAGYGVIDPAACLREALLVTPPREVR